MNTNSNSYAILISVRNDYDILEKGIHAWQKMNQKTPVVIIDDHSEKDQAEKGRNLIESFGGKWLASTLPQGKMNALLYGAAHVSADKLLLTDADCVPYSLDWPQSMDKAGYDLVLGFSPYKEEKGFLNGFVRFETIITGIQYMSWSLKGFPYMGVGRNMLIDRTKFLEYDPVNLPYGNDDHLTQWVANTGKVGACLEPETFIETTGPKNWKEWLKQKHRHLSAGHNYSSRDLLPPFIYFLFETGNWSLFLLLIFSGNQLGLIIWMFGLILRAITFRQWSVRFQDHKTFRLFPFWELFHLVILGALSLYAIIIPKKGWS